MKPIYFLFALLLGCICPDCPECPDCPDVPPIKQDGIILIFAENFDSITPGYISGNQKLAWNMTIGQFETYQVEAYPMTGHGNVLKLTAPAGTYSEPLANNYLMLDSIYLDIYYQYKIYVPGDWDQFRGGKCFGSFAGGSQVNIPYRGDTLSGFNTLMLFTPSGRRDWYNYTHNAYGYGNPITAQLQMPSADNKTPGLGKNYTWFVTANNFGTPTGYNGAFPGETYYNGSTWAWGVDAGTEGTIPPMRKGQWQTITLHLRLKQGGFSDIFEVYEEGVLKFHKWNNRYITANGAQGVEALYWNYFYGGGSADYGPPTDQVIYIDDIVVFYFQGGNENFSAETRNIGDQIPLLNDTIKLVKSLAKPINDERYTERSGTVYSHNLAFNFIPTDMTVNKWISVDNANAYQLILEQYNHDDCERYYKNWLNVYAYQNGNRMLMRTYNCSNYTVPDVLNVSADSIRLEYYTGQGRSNFQKTGWKITYTTNGTSSRKNPDLTDNMIAIKP